MACKAPGGTKKKYIYYKCRDCKTYVREDKLVEKMLNEMNTLIDYDINVRKFFAPVLKHKIENVNELLIKEINTLKDKVMRLKEAYLNKKIDIEEYKKEKEITKYHHKLLIADLLYINYVHSNFEYDGVTIEEIYKFVTKETRYNGLEQLEIIEEAKILFKIKYNKCFVDK